MADLQSAKIDTLQVAIRVLVEGTEFVAVVNYDDYVCVDLIRAVRNGKNPAKAFATLAEIGSKASQGSEEFQTTRANALGE